MMFSLKDPFIVDFPVYSCFFSVDVTLFYLYFEWRIIHISKHRTALYQIGMSCGRGFPKMEGTIGYLKMDDLWWKTPNKPMNSGFPHW